MTCVRAKPAVLETAPAGPAAPTPSGGLTSAQIAQVLASLQSNANGINQASYGFAAVNFAPAVAIMGLSGGGAAVTSLALRAAPPLATAAAKVIPQTPDGMGTTAFGKLTKWGRFDADALARIQTLTGDDLNTFRAAGVTRDMAIDWGPLLREHLRHYASEPK